MEPPCYAPVVSWEPAVADYLRACLGAERLAATEAALVAPPLAACLRANMLAADPAAVLADVTAARAAAAAAASSGGGAAAEPPLPPPHIHPLVPAAVIVPGRGPRRPDYRAAEGREVILSRRAGEAVLRGAHAFVPGVLACSAGVAAGDAVAVSIAVEPPGSDWCGITRGTTLPAACAPPEARGRLHIGVGRAALSRADMFRAQSGVAVELTDRVFDVPPWDGARAPFSLARERRPRALPPPPVSCLARRHTNAPCGAAAHRRPFSAHRMRHLMSKQTRCCAGARCCRTFRPSWRPRR